MNTHCHLEVKNTRAKTHGIKMTAVSTRFMPKVRIHLRNGRER
jgi:hypothetical protein